MGAEQQCGPPLCGHRKQSPDSQDSEDGVPLAQPVSHTLCARTCPAAGVGGGWLHLCRGLKLTRTNQNLPAEPSPGNCKPSAIPT